MKIGILTFYNVCNYGAVMQAWALSMALKKQNHSVSLVEYTPTKNKNNCIETNYCSVGSSIVKTIKYIVLPIMAFMKAIKYMKYKKFIKNELSITPINDKNKIYDTIVVGSDQVWNYKLTGGYDDYFWGNTKYKINANKWITYAVSINQNSFTDEEYVRKSLSNFKVLSVREKQSIKLLSSFTDKKIHHVCDPTYLLDKNDWLKIIKINKIPKTPYVFIYPVGNMKTVIEIGRRLAIDKKLNYYILVSNMFLKQDNHTKYFSDPYDFISLLYGAKYVVTSSFHGTILSTLFNKDFYSISHVEDSNERMLSLLDYLNLKDRLIDNYAAIKNTKNINWNSVNTNIEKFRKLSLDYLYKSII